MGQVPKLEAAPGQAAAKRAQQRSDRAQPAPALPHVPIVQRPSPKQITTAKQVISRAITREAGSNATPEQRDATVARLKRDPRAAHFIRAASHYARADERANAARIGRSVPQPAPVPPNPLGDLGAMGFEVPGRPLSERSAAIRRGRGEVVAQQARNVVGADRGDRKVGLAGLATINASALQRGLIGATSLNKGDIGPRTFAGRVGRDVKTLGEAPFVGGYTAAAAALEGLKKHPGLLALGPLYGGVAAIGTTPRGQALAKGVAQTYAQEARHPIKSFSEHPLLTGLDFAGAASVAGRLAGATARGLGSTVEAGGVRGKLARAGTTTRSPIALTDDPASAQSGAVWDRNFSKDLGRKQFQLGSDRTREVLKHPDGSPVTVERNGQTVQVLKPRNAAEREGLQKRQADFEQGRTNAGARAARAQASKESRVTRKEAGRSKRARDVVSMVTEGTITSAKHFEADLTAHRDRLQGMLDSEAKHPGTVFRHPEEIKSTKARVDLATSVLKSPKQMAQAEKIVAAGESHGGKLVAADTRKAELQLGDTEELRRARLKVAAVEHMGARHHTVEDHAALEADARKVEDAARAKVQAATPGTPDWIHAKGELAAAKTERIAVSGRDPSLVTRHEAAQGIASEAKTAHERAKAKVMRLTHSRQRLLGAQSSRRGVRGGAATVAEVNKLKKIDGLLKQAKAEERAASSKRTIAEHRARDTPMPPAQEALRTAEGKHLPTAEIEDFLRKRGRDPGTVAYLPGEVSSGHFYSQNRPGSRGTLSSEGPRTGAAHLKGTTEASSELLRAAGVRDAVVIHKAESIDRQIADHGLRHPAWGKAERGEPLTRVERSIARKGGGWNAAEAKEFIERQEATSGERYVAVRQHPAALDSESKRIIREDLQGPGAMESLDLRILNSRLVDVKTSLSGERNIVLMPAAQIERQMEHLRPAGDLERFFQFINRPFRMAVLPQFRWLTGNFVEPYVVRLTAQGSGLNVYGLAADLNATRKVIKSMEGSSDPRIRAAAKEVRAQQVGSGLFIGGGEVNSIHRHLADVSPKVYGAVVAKLPVVGQMTDMIGQAAHYLAAPLRLFFHANRVIETGAQRAAFGHDVRRDIQDFTGSWTQTVTLGKKAVEEAARGLTNTPTQRRFMRSQEITLGKYAAFSPKVRALVQGPAPFLPWAMNAARFVYWTMPTRHTALTSLLVHTNDVVSKDWQQLHQDVPPGGLKLAVPSKGGWVDLARYTPYGLSGPISEGDLGSITGNFVPQIQGAQHALQGQDPFGRPLQVAPTPDNPKGLPSTGQKVTAAGQSLIEAMVPYLNTLRRLREGGGTAYANSSVLHPRTKPDSSHMSAARRTFDPFRPTYLKAKPHPVATPPLRRAPATGRESLLEKAANRAAQGGLSDGQMSLLEKAAK